MSSLPSDEVAGDYRDALDDLITNDRFQIANLTMIAKENIEHAEAISRTLTLHIKKAPPSRKLPALYVLDSLVKNIGSPYTVYFGRNLHETYMLAYSQVDQPVRRKLEEMLKTWREPVPGSLSSTPVFPLQATQSIMDALNRFKASTAGRAGQVPLRAPSIVQAQAVNYRQTPTPPQLGPVYSQPQINVQNPTPTPPPQQYYQQPQQAPISQYPQLPQTHTPIQQFNPVQPPYQGSNGYAAPGIDKARLHADIDDLTTDAKIDCTTHPMDQSKLKKLETLQGLKAFLDSSAGIGEHDLREVRDTITREMEKRNAEKLASQHISPTPTPQLPYGQHPQSQWQPPAPYPQPQHSPYPQLPSHNPYPQSQYPSAPTPQSFQGPPPPPPAFLNSTNLAELLRSATNAQNNNNATPAVQNAYAQGYSVPMSNTPTLPSSIAPPNGATLSLLDQIRASGILSKVATPLQGTTPPMGYAQPASGEVPFASAAIKIPRPHLVLSFLNEKPNQCSTCGRRFASDEAGRAKKEKHLDWHFKTKARSLEAEQRGQNRSWYVDEMEWITSREYEDDLGLEDPAATSNGQASTDSAKKKEQDFVRTPSDPAYRNATCPIDQEPFKSEWSEDVQDFIWRDAVKVGDKYYHASCYKEIVKPRETTQTLAVPRTGTPLAGLGHRRTATPDSVLGKRKAEDDEMPSASKSRLKVEA